MGRKFTSAQENIVRIFHPVLQQELKDIAKDCDVPLQQVFNVFCNVIFDECDIDAMLIKTVADCEIAKEGDYMDIQ